MKKIYLSISILIIIATVYYAHIQAVEDFVPMPKYVENSQIKAEAESRVVHQLTSSGVDEDVIYNGESYRIMAAWQNSIETLLALGMGDRIIAAIGVPDSKYIAIEYQEEYKKIPYKSMDIPDIETTLLWEPDLLVGWDTTFQKNNWRSTNFWKERGVHTYIARSSALLSPPTVEGEYQYILDMGDIVNRRKRAEELVNRSKQYVQDVRAYARAHPTDDTVIILEPAGRQFGVYDVDTLGGNMVKEIDGNLITGVGETINIEELIELNPSVIFMVLQEDDYENEDVLIERLYDNPVLQHVDAIKNRRVYGIPLFMVYSAGVRIHDGLDIMIHGLYPNFNVSL